jgi:peptidoglycan/xylan/chitin deacetylase (PgdA/CDA1 family)
VNTLLLTFDDGPDRDTTPRLLDQLAEADARATFFVIAARAQHCPDLIGRMVAEGHTVGLHCDQHVRHSERSRDWIAADTKSALRRLGRLGVRPALWRTPWGVTSPWTAAVATDHRLRLTGWTVDTHDWRGDGAEALFASTRARLTQHAVVLAHDGLGPGALRTDAAQTLAYVELVLAHAAEKGLVVEAI